ncbi:MAG: hypothetical protein WBE26_06655 [Phycisphaerae bacterium]
MMTALLHACVCVGVAVSGGSPDTRALVEQALDEPATITLDNKRLGEAIQVVTDQTGVKIVMSPEVMDLVPHGAETLVRKVQIADMPLRQGLTKLFSPLGMTFVVRDDHVEIIPKDALRCLGRAPTWPELDTLMQLSTMQPGTDDEALAWLQSRIQSLVPVPGARDILAEAIRSVGAGPGDEVLSVACAQLGWAWCLSDRRIVVTSMEQHIRRRLQQPISLRINYRPLVEVFQALGERVNVPIRSEPGALALLPIHVQRNFSVNVHQQPAEQVLDQIAAYTGLGYLLEPDGVLFYNLTDGTLAREVEKDRLESRSHIAGPAPEGVSLSDPYVAKMVIPLENGKSIEWLIRRSELPEDLRQMRERDLAAGFEAARHRNTETQP